MKENQKKLFVKLFRYVTPYKFAITISLLAMLAIAIFEPMVPALLTPLIDENLVTNNYDSAWKIPSLLILVFVVKGLAEYIANVSSQWIANKAISEIRQDVFKHQISLPLETHSHETPGRITSRFLYDIPQISASISSAWIILIRDSLVLIALTSYLFYVSWALTIIMLIVAPPIAFLINRVGGKMRSSNIEIQEATGELAKAINQSINGIKEIKLYGNESHQQMTFKKVSEFIRQKTMSIVKLSAANVPTVQVLAALAVTIVIYVATLLSKQNELTPGQFVSYIAAMSLLFEPIRRLTSVNTVIQKGLAASKSIFNLLDLEKEETNTKDSLNQDFSISKFDNALPVIEFKNVSFKYFDQKEYALKDVSFKIYKNESIGIVGASGSGKTTVVNLLSGFYKVTEGEIRVGSINLNKLPLKELRKNISWVGQPVILFDGSIKSNVLMGCENSNDIQVVEALKKSNSMEFVRKLENNIDFVIGPNGSLLSGGQCQRLAIARSIIRNAPIFLFDEATSALDTQSEQAIFDAIAEIKKSKTTITIAHRISTIKSCDKIFVFDAGRIIQVGNHEELIRKDGKYKKLVLASEIKD